MIILEVTLHQNEGDTGRFDANSSSDIAQQFETLNFLLSPGQEKHMT